METTKLVQALTDFYNFKKVKSFGGSKNGISHNTTWGKLERIWNDGMGLISFAECDGDTLLINELFCSKSEIRDIQTHLTVKYEFVKLGYPDYYAKGLREMRTK